MTKNINFHDNVMFILKTSPRLIVSVLVYSFSLRSFVFISSVGRESCPHSDTLATKIYLTYIIRGLDYDKTVCDCTF